MKSKAMANLRGSDRDGISRLMKTLPFSLIAFVKYQ